MPEAIAAPCSPADSTRNSCAIDVSIVVVSWNVIDDLDRCLASLDEHLGSTRAQIIVVDNDSADGTCQMVRERYPHVELIANNDNRGFAAACNQGIEVARGRYVLMLNPDTIVLDDVIPRTIEWADEHEDVAVVGCQVLDGPESIQRTCFRFPSAVDMLLWVTGIRALAPKSNLLGRAAYGDWGRDGERDVDVVSGMYMLVRDTAIAEVGQMDEAYFVFAEEADWCWRFKAAGWRCVFAPVGRIMHVEGGSKSTNQVSLRMYVQMQKNLLRFLRTNRGFAQWLVAKAAFSIAMPIRALLFSVLSIVGGQPARHRLRQALAATRFHWSPA